MANPFQTVTEDIFSSPNSNKYLPLNNQAPAIEPVVKEEEKPIEEPPVAVQPAEEVKPTPEKKKHCQMLLKLT